MLSIANRITGVFLSAAALGLVVWLVAAATGPHAYAAVQGVLASAIGQIVLFAATFAFLLHFCGGIRHLIWDAGYGFELSAIYASGWAVVGLSIILTLASWGAALFVAR